MRTQKLALMGATIIAALAVLGTPASAQSSSNTIIAKLGASYDARAADLARCREIVDQADERDLPPSNVPSGYGATGAAGGVPGVAGAAIAGLIIGAVGEANARRHGVELCMHNLGYQFLVLTNDERRVYSSLLPARKIAWERRFMERDLSARIQAATVSALVPRLPEYQDGPMRSGGLQFEEFALSATDVHDGDDVLTGTARRWRTAVLVTPIGTKEGAVRVVADPGTVFHQVDYRRQIDPLLRLDGATWCGAVQQIANGNTSNDTFCFTGRDNGYEVFRPSGQPWLAGPYTNGFMLPLYDQPIRLEERSQDDLGPMDFTIKAVETTSGHIRLAAEVIHADKRVRLWLRQFSWDKGKAVLPLWDKRLVLTRGTKGAVTAELTSDGDGHDWRAGDLIN